MNFRILGILFFNKIYILQETTVIAQLQEQATIPANFIGWNFKFANCSSERRFDLSVFHAPACY